MLTTKRRQPGGEKGVEEGPAEPSSPVAVTGRPWVPHGATAVRRQEAATSAQHCRPVGVWEWACKSGGLLELCVLGFVLGGAVKLCQLTSEGFLPLSKPKPMRQIYCFPPLLLAPGERGKRDGEHKPPGRLPPHLPHGGASPEHP